MSYQFIEKPISYGRHEPEGIYLELPIANQIDIVQTWGTHPDFYAQYHYNGISLKGYIGIGFDLSLDTPIVAVDQGRISEINLEPHGFERYIKIEHWWGESLYARLQGIQVESGQLVRRNSPIAFSRLHLGDLAQRFHFGIRIRPYNRYDGWGGFSDPLPFLNPELLGNIYSSPSSSDSISPDVLNRDRLVPPLPLAIETSLMHRP
ncbi:MAG: peptidoglycan DD-metalloendopeptidase family protein [Chloroflexota bacterium]